MKLKIKEPALILALGFILLAAVLLARAQVVQQVTATNPKYPEFYEAPHQSQLKSLIQGSKAETLPDSRLQIYDAKVQSFETNGQTKLIIEAPQCIYDRSTHAVHSAGPLHAQTGDGKFMIDGTGFHFVQTNGVLFISNRVHTFVQAGLLESRSTNATAGSAPKIGDLQIASERFIFQTNGVATYLGNAEVSSTNLSLKGGSIVIVKSMEDRQVQSMTVETNVVMDYEKVHVEGERAVYGAQDGIARVTGHPKWRSEDREGHAEELVVDPTNKFFRATGQAYLKFSALTLTNSSFIPGQRVAATKGSTVTNHVVEISSDFYEFRTNSAQFGDQVALTETVNNQVHGTLNSSTLDVAFTGTNELQSLVARTNVVIRQNTNQLTADTATYVAATGNLELTGNPSWQSGPRGGRGEFITVNPQREEMLVRGDARMRVPAKDLGDSTDPAARQTNAVPDKPDEFADLYAEEYAFKPDRARFQRHVRIVHPQMNWSCDKLAVDSADATGKNVTMLAEGSVTFAFSSSNRSPVHGSCERAEYVHDLAVNPIIDRMEMTGHPVLETTNGVIRNSIIILDRAKQKCITPGEYVVSGKIGALGTNFLNLMPQKR